MSSDNLIALIRSVVRQYLGDVRLPQKGVVTAYDPDKHMAKVQLEPNGLETSWLQVATLGVGNGFGIVLGINLGDEVMVSFEGGDINSGVITGVVFNGQEPPTRTKAGELKIIHQGGSHLKFFSNGTVEVHAKGEEGQLKLMADEGGILISTPGLFVTNAGTTQGFADDSIPGGDYNADLHEDLPDE